MKFRREYPIPRDNVDFICLELQRVVEIDGKHHQTSDGQVYDPCNDRFLQEKSLRVLRIHGYQVMKDLSKVVASVRQAKQKQQAKPETES